MYFHAPIYGSQINAPAKLYKRFTPTGTALEMNGDIIPYEGNYYRWCANIPYIEATDKQLSDEHPIEGLIVDTGYLTIKYNGTYKPRPDDLREPCHGDIMALDGELWIIEDRVQRVRNKSLVNFATVYSPLRKLP